MCGRKDWDRVGSHVVEGFGEVGRHKEVQVWKGSVGVWQGRLGWV